jgi:hypothetical protein
MLRPCVPSSLLSRRALARSCSDLFGCVEGAPLPQHVGRQWTRLSDDLQVYGGTGGSIPGVCEVIRVGGDAVRPKGASMRDVGDIVRQRWADQEARQ